MLRIRNLLVAAALAAVTAVTLAGPASAGICDQQQGRRVLIDGVWHKIVHDKRGRAVDCGPGNAF